jgi:hypothetical protein
MIVLPASPKPNRMTVDYLDFGFMQSRVAASVRVDRPGNRHRITVSWPREQMVPGSREDFTARLKRGKREGVQVNIPLTADQGSPGTPVVNGAGQSGTTINLRGLTPGYVVARDFWLTIVRGDGVAFLHSVYAPVTANGSGLAAVQIEPALRHPFADGATVALQTPYVQGFLAGETFSYSIEEVKMTPLSITIEEYQ